MSVNVLVTVLLVDVVNVTVEDVDVVNVAVEDVEVVAVIVEELAGFPGNLSTAALHPDIVTY